MAKITITYKDIEQLISKLPERITLETAEEFKKIGLKVVKSTEDRGYRWNIAVEGSVKNTIFEVPINVVSVYDFYDGAKFGFVKTSRDTYTAPRTSGGKPYWNILPKAVRGYGGEGVLAKGSQYIKRYLSSLEIPEVNTNSNHSGNTNSSKSFNNIFDAARYVLGDMLSKTDLEAVKGAKTVNTVDSILKKYDYKSLKVKDSTHPVIPTYDSIYLAVLALRINKSSGRWDEVLYTLDKSLDLIALIKGEGEDIDLNLLNRVYSELRYFERDMREY